MGKPSNFSNLKGFLILANFGNFRVKFKKKRKPLLGWETFLEQKAEYSFYRCETLTHFPTKKDDLSADQKIKATK